MFGVVRLQPIPAAVLLQLALTDKSYLVEFFSSLISFGKAPMD